MIKFSTKTIKIALVGFLFAVIPAAPALAYAPSVQPLSSKPMFFIREHSGTSSSSAALTDSSSENWSGYAATGNNGTFTSVTSSWVQPTLSCTTSTTYSAYWVGLDGYSDQTVEQIGTEANCSSGTAQYYTWYEMYPQNPSEMITNLAVAAGNNMTASVTYNQPVTVVSRGRYRTVSNGSFTLTLNDVTTGRSYSTTQTANRSVNRASAEVITEAPYSNGILPLANFGTANYTASEVDGAPLSKAPGLQAVTMNDPYGMVATPSSLDSTGEDFSVTWSS